MGDSQSSSVHDLDDDWGYPYDLGKPRLQMWMKMGCTFKNGAILLGKTMMNYSDASVE